MLALALLLSPAIARALGGGDTLSVTTTGALGGTLQGLAVTHDNTDVAYIKSDRPNDEAELHLTFLFDVDVLPGHNPTTGFRQLLVSGHSNPGPTGCPQASAFRCFHYVTVSGGTETDTLQCYVRDNACQEFGTSQLAFSRSTTQRVCINWLRRTAPSAGEVSLVLLPGGAGGRCPHKNAHVYHWAYGVNDQLDIEDVRVGTPATNSFGAGEKLLYKFDSVLVLGERAP